jgi:hypothetical protein
MHSAQYVKTICVLRQVGSSNNYQLYDSHLKWLIRTTTSAEKKERGECYKITKK